MLPAGAEMKGVLSAMPRRTNPGPPRRCIHFHTESDTISRERNLILKPESPSDFSAAFVVSGDAENTHSRSFHGFCIARITWLKTESTPLGLGLSLGSPGDRSAFCFGQAVNRDRETDEGGAIKHEINADRQTNEKGAGRRSDGKKVDAENDRD